MNAKQMDLPYVADSDTSRAAAEQAAPRAAVGRSRVLELLRAALPDGLTDEQIARTLRMNPSTERPRRIELVRAQLVVDSGRTRHTRAKVRAVVWVATQSTKKQRSA